MKESLISCIDHPSTKKFGSGYRIGPRLILTAWHVLCPESGSAPADGYQVRFYPKLDVHFTASLCDRWSNIDIALLRLNDTCSDMLPEWSQTTQVRWGTLLIDQVGGALRCHCAGFPAVARNTRANRDEPLLVNGTIDWPPNDIGCYRLTGPSPAPKNDEEWCGISGAAIFVQEHLVGIVTDADNRYRTGMLLVRPLGHLFENADFRKYLAEDAAVADKGWQAEVVPTTSAPAVVRASAGKPAVRIEEVLSLLRDADAYNFEKLIRCYQRSVPDLSHPRQASDLLALVADLLDLRTPQSGIPPVVGFVMRLMGNDGEVIEWSRRQIGEDVLDALKKTIAEEEMASTKPARLIVYWPYPEEGDVVRVRLLLPDRRQPLELELESRGRTKHEALVGAVEKAEIHATDLEIEIFVPMADLATCDAETAPRDFGGCLGEIPLGAGYPVMLRWRERAEGRNEANYYRWKVAAKAIKSQCHSERHVPLRKITTSHGLGASPQKMIIKLIDTIGGGGCLLYNFVPEKEDRVLQAALLGGMPFALWSRQNQDGNAFEQTAKEKMDDRLLTEIPLVCRDWRANGGQTALTLFFDDPATNPLFDARLDSLEAL